MSKGTVTIERKFLEKHLSLLSRAGLMFTGVVGLIDSIDELREIVNKSVCKKCNGTGEMDTGGFTPWGADITVTCDCVEENRYE